MTEQGVQPETRIGADGRTPLISARGISKTFLHVRALDGVDFDVFPGETVALVGDNGAGKSTLMKILCGAYQADEGRIILPCRSAAGKDGRLRTRGQAIERHTG